MKKDITNRDDIVLLVNTFYDKVKKDEIIGHIFSEVAQLNWDNHLPAMQNFWAGILLDEHSYVGNPMLKHIELNKQYPLIEKHFQVWLEKFQQTVDELFEGTKAEEAKSRAVYIGQLLQHKIKISERDSL